MQSRELSLVPLKKGKDNGHRRIEPAGVRTENSSRVSRVRSAYSRARFPVVIFHIKASFSFYCSFSCYYYYFRHNYFCLFVFHPKQRVITELLTWCLKSLWKVVTGVVHVWEILIGDFNAKNQRLLVFNFVKIIQLKIICKYLKIKY